MLGWLAKAFRSPPAPHKLRAQRMEKRVRILGAYDAAKTTDYNIRHWSAADTLSADSANSASVRRTLRSRARYEAQESNSYAKGIVLTLANDCIGTGPKLQILTPDRAANVAIERAFGRWAKLIFFAEKLRTMRVAKCVDGEAFALFGTNRRLDGVQLDFRLIEADQVATPFVVTLTDVNTIDGVRFDEFGSPLEYHLLSKHPGDTSAGINPFGYRAVPADEMLHIFRCDRPGQHRGIPEIAPALPLFAMLRDYTLAVLSSAKTAAKIAAVLETAGSSPADDGSSHDPQVEPFDAVDIDFDMMTSLPFGWKMNQFKAEQPTTTYEMFHGRILNEIGRCLNMPLNVALGDSSKYNYASGRLDHQMYFKSIEVERSHWECCVLDRVLAKWFDEAALVPGLVPEGLGAMDELPHQWQWDGREHIDPAKEANGESTRLANGTVSRARAYAQQGLDMDTEDERSAAGYGVSVDEYRRRLLEKHLGAGASQESRVESPET